MCLHGRRDMLRRIGLRLHLPHALLLRVLCRRHLLLLLLLLLKPPNNSGQYPRNIISW